MKALTLHQPWAYAVAHLGKRIENRKWLPPPVVRHSRIAIHAAAMGAGRREREAVAALRAKGYDVPDVLPRGCVVAVAKVLGWRYSPRPEDGDWWIGPVGWELGEVVALDTPVACTGYQRLWNLPDDVEAAVREAVLR